MPRALSWAVVAAAFTAGLYLPDLVAHAAAPAPKAASGVAVEAAPESDAPRGPAGLAPGSAMSPGKSGGLEAEETAKITPLLTRDPSAMVMGPSLGGARCKEPPACDCSEDSLHRYQPKSQRKRKPAAPKPLPG